LCDLFLGIEMISLTPTIVNMLRTFEKRLPKDFPTVGVLVPKILKNSPASLGGIQPRDIIVEFDGHPVKSSDEILNLVGDEVGRKIKVKILRIEDGKVAQREFTLITEALKDV